MTRLQSDRSSATWIARQRTWALAGGVLLLAACAGPTPYTKPASSVPAHWGNQAAASTEWGTTPWKSLYTEAPLQSLIELALARNADLRQAVARIEEARALWGLQQADQMPTVAVGASHTSARTPPLVQGNNAALNVRRYDLGLNLLAYELDVWGRMASLTEAARRQFEATQEDQRTIRITLISDVAHAYYAWQEARQRLRLLEQTEALRERLHALTLRRQALGTASELDVALTQSALMGARSEWAAMQRQSEQARNALGLLIGGQWPEGWTPAPDMNKPEPNTAWGTGLSSEVLLNRPDVKAAELRLQAAHANIHAARMAFFPRLQLTGLVGSASPALNNLMGGGSQAWSLVPSLQLPIFDGGRAESGVDLAQARKNLWVINYEKTIQQAFREVADLLATRDTLGQQWTSQQAQLQALRERLRLIDVRQRLGAANLSEKLEAEREVLVLEQVMVQTQRQWLAANGQLFKALGGGDI